MNILFIAPRLPLPADTGGKIRTWNLLKQLAKRVKVHLVCYAFEQQDAQEAEKLKRDGINVTLVPVKEPGFMKKVMLAIFQKTPVSVAKYYSEDMESIVTELNETNRFDAVHIDHIHMAHYCRCFDDAPCLIDEHNIEYKILERCANVEKDLTKKWLYRNQARKMKHFERDHIRKANGYFAVSEDDKNILDQMHNNGHVGHVVPNGVDTEYFQIEDSEKKSEEQALVFTGSMDWLPNDDAAVYFCNDILPIIWETKPNVKFYIIGKDPSMALKKKAKSDERIIVTGRVDDVRTYVAKSKIFVVPLRIGGGTRLKILEAMSMQKVVISTKIGADGIDYTEYENIVLADEPKTFAQSVIDLLDDEEKCTLLGQSGRALVLEQYDWNVVGTKLGMIYEQIKSKK